MPTHTPLTTFDNFVFNWKTSPQSELEIPGMGDLVVRNFWDGSWEYWLNAQWEFDSAIYLQMELPETSLDIPPAHPLETFTPIYFRNTQGFSYDLAKDIIQPLHDDLWSSIFKEWDNGDLAQRSEHIHSELQTRWLDAPRP